MRRSVHTLSTSSTVPPNKIPPQNLKPSKYETYDKMKENDGMEMELESQQDAIARIESGNIEIKLVTLEYIRERLEQKASCLRQSIQPEDVIKELIELLNSPEVKLQIISLSILSIYLQMEFIDDKIIEELLPILVALSDGKHLDSMNEILIITGAVTQLSIIHQEYTFKYEFVLKHKQMVNDYAPSYLIRTITKSIKEFANKDAIFLKERIDSIVRILFEFVNHPGKINPKNVFKLISKLVAMVFKLLRHVLDEYVMPTLTSLLSHQNYPVRKYALKTIANVSFGTVGNNSVIFKCDLLPKLAVLYDTETYQHYILVIFMCMIHYKEGIMMKYLIEKGLFETILKHLKIKRHEINRKVIKVIEMFITKSVDNLVLEMASSGAIEILVKLMRSRSDLQIRVCLIALRKLFDASRGNHAYICNLIKKYDGATQIEKFSKKKFGFINQYAKKILKEFFHASE